MKQEHVSEYGVHWNFFFTIAFLRLLVVLLHYTLPSTQHPPTAAAFGVAVLMAYNYALSDSGLATWIQTAPRTTLVQQNREGLCSLVGYLGLYLVGILVGWMQNMPSTRDGWGRYKSHVVWLTTAALWVLTVYTR
jgi:phosphatidylinositol glycan class W